MAKSILTVTQLSRYYNKILEAADHHAPQVKKVVPRLATLVLEFQTYEGPLKVWSRKGSIGLVLWAFVNGGRYVFRYNHSDRKIEIVGENIRGDVICQIDNKTPQKRLRELFENEL